MATSGTLFELAADPRAGEKLAHLLSVLQVVQFSDLCPDQIPLFAFVPAGHVTSGGDR